MGLALLGKVVVRVWVGPQVQPSYWLLFGAALWLIVDVCGGALYIFLAGANFLKFLIAVMVLTAVANLPLKIFGAKAFGLGAVVWTTALSALLGTMATSIYAYRVLNRMEETRKAPRQGEGVQAASGAHDA
jgi:O-antigen/teichoic acid export membrane protein